MQHTVNEIKILADFQPLEMSEGAGLPGLCITAMVNWVALFGVACVVGLGLRLGLGL